jgi:excisionase family DNA binding protein
MTGPEAPELISTKDASRILGVNESTVARYAKAGTLKAYLLPGGARRFLRSDVEALLVPEHPDPESNERASHASQ